MKMTLPVRLSKGFVLLALIAIAGLALAACDKPNQVEIPESTSLEGNMFVFDYQGKFIPAEQLRWASPHECKKNHWHAGGEVVTLQGEVLPDPDPEGCGFGRWTDLPILDIPMPDDYQGSQRTRDFYFRVQFDPD